MGMIDSGRMLEAFLKGGLGTEKTYPWWTTIWGIRAKIWDDEDLATEAKQSLGNLIHAAIDDGNAELIHDLAAALELIEKSERKPENALRADVFFAIQELNHSRDTFTRRDVLTWLNDEMDASVPTDELERELDSLRLSTEIES